MCLARETLEGLQITGKLMLFKGMGFTIMPQYFLVMSFVEFIDYIFKEIPGVKVFFSKKLCQDPLESFFGHQRMRGGYSCNPSVQTFLHGTVSLRLQGSVGLQPVRGTCKRGLAYCDPQALAAAGSGQDRQCPTKNMDWK